MYSKMRKSTESHTRISAMMSNVLSVGMQVMSAVVIGQRCLQGEPRGQQALEEAQAVLSAVKALCKVQRCCSTSARSSAICHYSFNPEAECPCTAAQQ